ncbi:MAG: DNA repair protein RadA [Planctomycetes bacterium]|nr:DNA repair protein RadA [Planctomycetota bacterium]
MSKLNVVYVCQECGWNSHKWIGRCSSCGEWDTLIEEKSGSLSGSRMSVVDSERPVSISSVRVVNKLRLETKIDEFDRILGGGIVNGSAILIGGTPGIGKSTILLQVCQQIGNQGFVSLYVTGEESVAQLKLRAERISVTSEKIFLVAENNLPAIFEHIKDVKPTLVIIDSIQTMFNPDIGSAPGTVSQVRQCAHELIFMAKKVGSSVLFAGHVTKQGAIAGPKVLEHLVDTVLYFEGEGFMSFRVLRAAKNRFGSTNEIGIFEMSRNGLKEVKNPSEIFLSTKQKLHSGATVIACIEGTRALLVEVQSLVTKSNYGIPERKVSGVDHNRVAMIMAVLQKRVGILLGSYDIFVNVVGGVRVEEPAADLGIAIAIVSSFRDKEVPAQTVFIGELGLGGEVRGVNQFDTRIKEAEKLGFKNIIFPVDNNVEISGSKTLKMHNVSSLREAIDEIW